MLIKNLFERDIFRPINGVVKRRTSLTIPRSGRSWMSLSSRENSTSIFESLSLGISKPWTRRRSRTPPARWASGFRASSALVNRIFLEVLSYLLSRTGRTSMTAKANMLSSSSRAKLKTPCYSGTSKKAVVGNNDVILFNIDSKADHGSGTGRDLILRVFLKVLNELQGYSGDYSTHRPHGAIPRIQGQTERIPCRV